MATPFSNWAAMMKKAAQSAQMAKQTAQTNPPKIYPSTTTPTPNMGAYRFTGGNKLPNTTGISGATDPLALQKPSVMNTGLVTNRPSTIGGTSTNWSMPSTIGAGYGLPTGATPKYQPQFAPTTPQALQAPAVSLPKTDVGYGLPTTPTTYDITKTAYAPGAGSLDLSGQISAIHQNPLMQQYAQASQQAAMGPLNRLIEQQRAETEERLSGQGLSSSQISNKTWERQYESERQQMGDIMSQLQAQQYEQEMNVALAQGDTNRAIQLANQSTRVQLSDIATQNKQLDIQIAEIKDNSFYKGIAGQIEMEKLRLTQSGQLNEQEQLRLGYLDQVNKTCADEWLTAEGGDGDGFQACVQEKWNTINEAFGSSGFAVFPQKEKGESYSKEQTQEKKKSESSGVSRTGTGASEQPGAAQGRSTVSNPTIYKSGKGSTAAAKPSGSVSRTRIRGTM